MPAVSRVAREKARVLFEIASNEAQNARRFFSAEGSHMEGAGSDSQSATGSASKRGGENAVDFLAFYQFAIKGRVQRKLEEEARRENRGEIVRSCDDSSDTADPVDDKEYPEFILLDEPIPETVQAVEVAVPVRRPPKRRAAATNFALLG